MRRALNENIKIERLSRGLNQVAFAKLLGVTNQCVSNWENDNVLPSIEMLVKIADVLCVSTDHLLGRSTEATVDVSALTDEQRGHVALLVNDLSLCNAEAGKKRP